VGRDYLTRHPATRLWDFASLLTLQSAIPNTDAAPAGVLTSAAIEQIAASAPVQYVSAPVTRQSIQSLPALQLVVTSEADQLIIATLPNSRSLPGPPLMLS
jgi:hypothetical protein